MMYKGFSLLFKLLWHQFVRNYGGKSSWRNFLVFPVYRSLHLVWISFSSFSFLFCFACIPSVPFKRAGFSEWSVLQWWLNIFTLFPSRAEEEDIDMKREKSIHKLDRALLWLCLSKYIVHLYTVNSNTSGTFHKWFKTSHRTLKK